MRIRYLTGAGIIFRFPLVCTGRALCQFPVETKQVFEIVITPFYWRYRPCAFETTGNRISSIALAVAVFPAQALLFNACSCRFHGNILTGIGSTMGFTE